LQTFENSLSSDGQFITVSNDEIDPENISVGDNGAMDEDIYTNSIWVPNSRYVNEGWNPYTNGRWRWTQWGFVGLKLQMGLSNLSLRKMVVFSCLWLGMVTGAQMGSHLGVLDS